MHSQTITLIFYLYLNYQYNHKQEIQLLSKQSCLQIYFIITNFSNWLQQYYNCIRIKERKSKIDYSLLGHNFDANCLKLAKFWNYLISGGRDSKILFWPITLSSIQNGYQNLFFISTLLICLIMNSKEDLLISAGLDQTIHISKKNNATQFWKFSQVIKEHNEIVINIYQQQCKFDNILFYLKEQIYEQYNIWIKLNFTNDQKEFNRASGLLNKRLFQKFMDIGQVLQQIIYLYFNLTICKKCGFLRFQMIYLKRQNYSCKKWLYRFWSVLPHIVHLIQQHYLSQKWQLHSFDQI
ncbi:unnamed protein product [Paramecium octaurelia]|uniref:Uncharacterized protein n=1 Tax=Paramecium octaurelia TaxID=43137 RepID=A0A8S1U8E2_PAROT|nr:unnamed protein product [Paramecium octaurelia]